MAITEIIGEKTKPINNIGVHQDGLVHKSQMSNKFIKHPLDVVKLNDVVEVKVIGLDIERDRISLSMKI